MIRHMMRPHLWLSCILVGASAATAGCMDVNGDSEVGGELQLGEISDKGTDLESLEQSAEPGELGELGQGDEELVRPSAESSCTVSFWTGECFTHPPVPANHSQNRVYIGIDTGLNSATTDYRVVDLGTGVVVRSGRVGKDQHFRQYIYGLYNSGYQLQLLNSAHPTRGFICDC